MKILISQEEYVKKTRSYDALERVYYDFLDGHEIIPLPNLIKVEGTDINLSEFKLLEQKNNCYLYIFNS